MLPQAAAAESAGRPPSEVLGACPNSGLSPHHPDPLSPTGTTSDLRAPSPMSQPGTAIRAPEHHGAVGYMIERLKGRPSFQTDISRAKNLELAFKSVAYANELGRLTRTNVLAHQAEVHTLLEVLEDRIIARFRGLYKKAGIVLLKQNPLFKWTAFEFTTLDNKLAKIGKKQPEGTHLPFEQDIRKTFFTPLVEADIQKLEKRDLKKYPRRARHQCN